MAPAALMDLAPKFHGLQLPSKAIQTLEESRDESHIPSHPLGIRPLGNRLLHGRVSARENTGQWQVLPDEVLETVLDSLDARDLRFLGYTCKFLYAFCHEDERWKNLFLQSSLAQQGSSVTWLGSWRATLLDVPVAKQAIVDCSTVFSDVLYRPFFCRHVNPAQFAASIPTRNQIKRIHDLSYVEFAEHWSRTPFILEDSINAWTVSHDWSLEYFLAHYASTEFRAESVDWSFSTYHDYMANNLDESPLYLFDRKFAEKMSLTIEEKPGAAYWKPRCFGPDLFELLGDERPAHRWLIIGPQNSGSTFHKDPNGTSAWNAVIQGAKYWIMFPPSTQVPGVYVSNDKSEVTSPLSIAEWLLEFHAEARELAGCVEGVCRAGELLHVPSGWWHLVVNLEKGIAITQNFVSKAHVASVMEFLRDQPESITGFSKDVANPYSLFVDRLAKAEPELHREAIEELKRRDRPFKRKWAGDGEDSEEAADRQATGFSFGFGGDEEEIP